MPLPLFESSTCTHEGNPGRGHKLGFDMRSLFVGRSETTSSPDTTPSHGRKAPRLGFQAIPRARLDSPYLHHHHTRSSRGRANGGNDQSGTGGSYRVRTNSSPARPTQARTRTTRTRVGFGPEDGYLAALAHEGRQYREQRRRKGSHNQAQRSRCFPRVTHPFVRRKLFNCLISGMLLATILSIYLGLAIGRPLTSQPFHITLILLILTISIFFSHSLIRLCIFAAHKQPSTPTRHRPNDTIIPKTIGPGGFAAPEHPIPVILARDEEAILGDEAKTECPPPAYGLWRGSVKLDPNMLHWQQRNLHPALRGHFPAPVPRAAQEGNGTRTTRVMMDRRPPSYISDDGVECVVAAAAAAVQHRSMAQV